VIARTSVMSYKKKEERISEIAKELDAGSVVEGSVRKAGNRVRVTAQLINGVTQGHLWSSHYDGNLDDIFAVQSEIAEKVAAELKIRLLDTEKKTLEKKPTTTSSEEESSREGNRQRQISGRLSHSSIGLWSSTPPLQGRMSESRNATLRLPICMKQRKPHIQLRGHR